MTLFFQLLPIYLLGNLHCIGMCGPIVMLLGRHPYRSFYFLGRLLAFGWAGLIAGWGGEVIQIFLKTFHLAGLSSLLFGIGVCLWAVAGWMGWQKFSLLPFNWKPLQRLQETLSTLPLQETPHAVLLFGFLTILLPCGQTLLVFSACAVAGDPWVGLFNGVAFAVLTSPSLFFAMQAQTILKRLRTSSHLLILLGTFMIGTLALCRGCAELGWIPHWIIQSGENSIYHLTIF